MDAHGYSQADVAKITGLSTQHVSQLANRTKPYTRPPTIPKMTGLAKIPGLTMMTIARAVWESMGLPLPAEQPESPLRKAAQATLSKIPEEKLGQALKHLAAILESR